jgi:hypothetical protein
MEKKELTFQIYLIDIENRFTKADYKWQLFRLPDGKPHRSPGQT